jgi:hypothetical protein
MGDRADIARRHRLPPSHADKLVGNTAEELEADAAARAALVRALSPRRVDDGPAPEPPVEGLPPKDKPIADYTEAEHEASLAEHMRVMREREREAEEERRRQADLANRTDDQRIGDWIAASGRPGAKQARNVEALRELGLLEEEG